MQFQSFFTFYLLLNIMIPLDLTITLLFAKMMYVTILQNDYEMYDLDKSIADG